MIKAKGASLTATERPIDTSSAADKRFLDILGVFAESNLRCKRQLEGIAKAKAADTRFVICSEGGPEVEHQFCWTAESSQLPPCARMKVHKSVTSLGSPPSTMRPLARSTMLSLSAYFMATVA